MMSPRMEVLLEEICRKFCAEQEQHLREVVTALKQTALSEAERYFRENRSLRSPSSAASSTSLSAFGSFGSMKRPGTRHPTPTLSLLMAQQASHSSMPSNPSAPPHSVSKLQQPQQQRLQVQPKMLTPSTATPEEASLPDKDFDCPGEVPDEMVYPACNIAPASICEGLVENLDQATVPGGAPSLDSNGFRQTLEGHLALSRAGSGMFSMKEAPEVESQGEVFNTNILPSSRLQRERTTSTSDSRGRLLLRGSSSKNVHFDVFKSASGLWQSVGGFFGSGAAEPSEEEEVEVPKTEAQRKAAQRLRTVLGLGSKDRIVPKEVLAQCLSKRMALPEEDASSLVTSFMAELYDIRERLQSMHSSQKSYPNRTGSEGVQLTTRSVEGPIRLSGRSTIEGIPLDLLATVVSLPDPAAYTRSTQKKLVSEVSEALLTVTTAEAIDEVTKSGAADFLWVSHNKVGEAWETQLNIFVSIVIFINLASAGISVDHAVDSIWWVCLETACALVMVMEAIIKTRKWGVGGYFRGEQCYWNWLDLTITCLGILDVIFTILNHFIETNGVTDGQGLKIAVAFRALRIARIVRMVKVVSNPLLKDLAKMVVGFIIGLPQLVWVTVMFSGILYLTGLFFRLTFGPSSTLDRLSDVCPSGDEILPESDSACEVHQLYGEEFFSTVQVSMFTCFRFMLGDFGTRGGKNLVVALSEHYGFWFNGVFGIWMIVVIFGVFNIISAIFVDATITGLKHNEVKKKYVEQYEKQFVREKLTVLMERIRILYEASGINSRDFNMMRPAFSGPTDEIMLDEAEFIDVMQDPVVKSYLEELDIVMYNPADLFDTFDPDGRGRVTGPEMVAAFVKLRGEPQKNDLVAAWLSLRGLHDKIDELRVSLAHHVHHMEVQATASRNWTDPSAS